MRRYSWPRIQLMYGLIRSFTSWTATCDPLSWPEFLRIISARPDNFGGIRFTIGKRCARQAFVGGSTGFARHSRRWTYFGLITFDVSPPAGKFPVGTKPLSDAPGFTFPGESFLRH